MLINDKIYGFLGRIKDDSETIATHLNAAYRMSSDTTNAFYNAFGDTKHDMESFYYVVDGLAKIPDRHHRWDQAIRSIADGTKATPILVSDLCKFRADYRQLVYEFRNVHGTIHSVLKILREIPRMPDAILGPVKDIDRNLSSAIGVTMRLLSWIETAIEDARDQMNAIATRTMIAVDREIAKFRSNLEGIVKSEAYVKWGADIDKSEDG